MILRRWSKSPIRPRSWAPPASSAGVRLACSAFQSVQLAGIERAATVWQDHENEEDAAPPDAVDHGQRLASKAWRSRVMVSEFGISR